MDHRYWKKSSLLGNKILAGKTKKYLYINIFITNSYNAKYNDVIKKWRTLTINIILI